MAFQRALPFMEPEILSFAAELPPRVLVFLSLRPHLPTTMKNPAALALAALLAATPAMAIEEPAFETVKKSGDFELRQYAPMIVAEAFVQGGPWGAGNDGFRVIAGYIFGNNTSVRGGGSEKVAMTAPVTMEPSTSKSASEKIAMTAPVTMEAAPAKSSEKIAMTAPVTMEASNDGAPKGGAERWRMHFVMPSKYTMATLPKPNDPRVQLREIPAHRMAAVRFSGLATQGNVKEQTDALLAWMKAEGLEASGTPQLARYDTPWTLPFLRRNEILIPIR